MNRLHNEGPWFPRLIDLAIASGVNQGSWEAIANELEDLKDRLVSKKHVMAVLRGIEAVKNENA